MLEEQLDEVYGLKPEVLERLKQRCSLISPANIQKIPLQTASLEELAQLPYFCLLYTSPSPRDLSTSRMPSSA